MQAPVFAERTPMDSQRNEKWGLMDYATAFAKYTSEIVTEKVERKIRCLEIVGNIILLADETSWECWRVEGEAVRWVAGRAETVTGLGYLQHVTVLAEKAPCVAVAGADVDHWPLRLYSLPQGHYVNTLRLRAPILGVRAADLITVTHAHCVLIFDQMFNKLHEVRTHVFGPGMDPHAAVSVAGALVAVVGPSDTHYWADLTRTGLTYLAEKAASVVPSVAVGAGAAAALTEESSGCVMVLGARGQVATWPMVAQALAWSPSGRLLAAVSLTGQQVSVARLERGSMEVVAVLSRGLTQGLLSLSWAPDEHWLGATSTRGTLHVWPLHPAGTPPTVATHLRLPGNTPAGPEALARVHHTGLVRALWTAPNALLLVGTPTMAYRLQAHLDLEAQAARLPPRLAARLTPHARYDLRAPGPGTAWVPAPQAHAAPHDWVSLIDIQSCEAEPLWRRRKVRFRLLQGVKPHTEASPSQLIALAKVSVPVGHTDDQFDAAGLVRGTTSLPGTGVSQEMNQAISTPLKPANIQEQPVVLAGEDLKAALARSIMHDAFQPVEPYRLQGPLRSPELQVEKLYPVVEPAKVPTKPASQLEPQQQPFRFAFTDSDDEPG